MIVPQQLFALTDSLYLGVMEDVNSMIVLDIANHSAMPSIAFESTPVSITRENGEVLVMTKDLRFFTIAVEDGKVVSKEKQTDMTNVLKGVGCMWLEAFPVVF